VINYAKRSKNNLFNIGICYNAPQIELVTFHLIFLTLSSCCDRKARAASGQSFTLWQQATIEIMRGNQSIIACSRHVYMGVVLRAHPVRGESHIQRNANREVATLLLGV